MLNTIVSILLPIFFVLALGYAAGRAKQFDSDQVQGLNELVLDYALPASLFVGTTRTARGQLLQEGPFTLALLIALVGFYLVICLWNLRLLHRDSGTSALRSLLVANPSAPFIGTAILGGLSGPSSSLSIGITAVIINVIQVPIALVLIELSRSQKQKQASLGQTVRTSFLRAIKKPIVWVPIVSVVLVLAGVKVPGLIDEMLNLIGTTSTGVALFVVGLTLAAHKLKLNREVIVNSALKVIAQPLLMTVFVLWFGIRNPDAQNGILICALASGSIGVVLASRYRFYESEASSTLVLTYVLTIVAVPIIIALTGRF